MKNTDKIDYIINELKDIKRIIKDLEKFKKRIKEKK